MWTIGVLTYELNSGRAPFESEDRKLTARKIKRLEYEMPEYFSNDLADFISRLLVLDPCSRMTED
jgi:serine/threonine protein kinase